MPQLVTRVPDALLREVDRLIADGAAESRSDLVRAALALVIDRHRRAEAGRLIVEEYAARPQTDDDIAWSDGATIAMIADEPW